MKSPSATMLAGPSLQPRPRLHPGSEGEMVARLVWAVERAGVRVDPSSIVNCYVALKSKPLMILAGPGQCGKALLVEHLTQVFTQVVWRNQMMLGHAWWAEGTQNVALFTEAQTRWNSSKVLALIEEASLPESSDRMFIGRLHRISPCELEGYFSELAFQLQHKRLMQLPSLHLAEPIACPRNFFLLGTMDSLPMDCLDGDLLSQTTVVPWPAAGLRPPADRRSLGSFIPAAERLFLRSCIRSAEAAFHKLHRLQGWRPQLMWPLCAVVDLLRQHQAVLPQWVMGEAMIYVANAWSAGGEGLFDPAPTRNLTIALDFSIMQSLLMRACETIRDSAALCTRLAGVLNTRFPHSMAFLQILQHGECRGTGVHRPQVLQPPANPKTPLPPPESTAPMADPAFSHSG